MPNNVNVEFVDQGITSPGVKGVVNECGEKDIKNVVFGEIERGAGSKRAAEDNIVFDDSTQDHLALSQVLSK